MMFKVTGNFEHNKKRYEKGAVVELDESIMTEEQARELFNQGCIEKAVEEQPENDSVDGESIDEVVPEGANEKAVEEQPENDSVDEETPTEKAKPSNSRSNRRRGRG